MRSAAGVLLVSAVAFASVMASAGVAEADAPSAPGNPAVAFAGWSAGMAELTVSWTPEAGVDGYEVADRFGTTAPTDPGGGVDVPGASSTSVTIPLNDAGGPLAVSVWAYTGASASNVSALSAPASTTFVVPGPPTVTSAPVSGVVGEATFTWGAPTFAGDTLVVREGAGAGTGPTGGTAVPAADGQTSATVSGLPNLSPSNPEYPVAVYELGGGNPQDWSPASTTLVLAAPGPETMANFAETDNATASSVSWLPANCTAPVSEVCINSVLLENPGTKVAADPTDGTLETPAVGVPNGTSRNISGLVAGQTYTFTVFNVITLGSTEYWSAGSSKTLQDLALPKTSLTSAPASSTTVGKSVLLTAKLTTIGTNPTGTITFSTNKGVLCSKVAVTAAHTAQCQASAATLINAVDPIDPDSTVEIDASYNGDSMDLASEADVVLTVAKAASTEAVHVAGQHTSKATVTASVSGPAGAGTGTVTMSSGSRRLCQVALHSGQAKCSVTAKALGAGKHTITVSYAGSTLYFAHSAKVTVTLKK